MSNLRVELEGRGPITLRQTDYAASGGEASVYRVNDTVVKIYTDTRKAERENMAGKIGRLKTIRHPNIVVPQGIVSDQRGRPIGVYMPFAKGEPLARVFTNDFRIRERFNDAAALKLVEHMRDTVHAAHASGAVMVDANELNWVVTHVACDPQPQVFDVDSWAIGTWGASAIMPSIRDWHSRDHTVLTDWFSWGIVTFQVFTGIHPYQGTLVGFKRGDLIERMKANASVFRPGIGLNRAVRDFGVIPGALLDWYRAAFEQGVRTSPPSAFNGPSIAPAARVVRAVATSSGALIHERLFGNSSDPVVRVWPSGIVALRSGALYDLARKKQIGTLASLRAEVVRVSNGWLVADWKESEADYMFVDDRTLEHEPVQLGLQGSRFVRFAERLFLATGSELCELVLLEAGRHILSVSRRTPILQPQSVQWFDGFGLQSALGASFLTLPFGDTACRTVRVRELDSLVPIAGKAGQRYVALTVQDTQGAYHRIDLVFAADYSSYSVQRTPADSSELNVALLPKGVAASIAEDGELVILVPTTGVKKVVQDPGIATNMVLSNWGNTVTYVHDGFVWSMTMK